MAVPKNLALNQFFTPPDLAHYCWARVQNYMQEKMPCTTASQQPPLFPLFLEPCAGTGAFYDLMPEGRRLAIEIDPDLQRKSDMQWLLGDFLSCLPTSTYAQDPSRVVAVMNPPFSNVGPKLRPRKSLIPDFFNQAAKWAHTICILVPANTGRFRVRERMDPMMHLHAEWDLGSPSFLLAGQLRNVQMRCCFQIWVRGQVPRAPHPDRDLKKQWRNRGTLWSFVPHAPQAQLKIACWGSDRKIGEVSWVTDEDKARFVGHTPHAPFVFIKTKWPSLLRLSFHHLKLQFERRSEEYGGVGGRRRSIGQTDVLSCWEKRRQSWAAQDVDAGLGKDNGSGRHVAATDTRCPNIGPVIQERNDIAHDA